MNIQKMASYNRLLSKVTGWPRFLLWQMCSYGFGPAHNSIPQYVCVCTHTFTRTRTQKHELALALTHAHINLHTLNMYVCVG